MGHEHGPTEFLDRAPTNDRAQEQIRKSFDLTAGVRILREGIGQNGRILPETRQQVLDEGLSYFVEGIDRASCTSFTLKRGEDDELVYFKQGAWTSYMTMLLEGRKVAEAEAEKDPRKAFLYGNAVEDYAHGLEMQALKPGQQIVWTSQYRQDIEDLYGKDFMQHGCGMHPGRKMGFIYRAFCNEDGSVTLQSQTVDRANDPELMERVRQASTNPSQKDGIVTMRALVAAYDEKLTHRYGAKTFAGRLGAEKDENAWTKLLEQEDLIDFYFQELEAFARSTKPIAELTEEVQDFHYGVWAALKERIIAPRAVAADALVNSGQSVSVASVAIQLSRVQVEIAQAHARYRSRGETMVGCGGAIKGNQQDTQNPEEIFDEIFGEETTTQEGSEDCDFISEECPNCHTKKVHTVCKNGKYYGACGCVSK